jgi:hypothetical protein
MATVEILDALLDLIQQRMAKHERTGATVRYGEALAIQVIVTALRDQVPPCPR